MTTTNRGTQQNADQKLVDGLNKHKNAIPSLPVGGKTITPDDAIRILQARIDASNEALKSKASAKASVVAERAERSQTRQFVASVRQVIHSMFGASLDILADFGLTPPKPHKVSPKTKVDAAQKALATRTLRHTLGKKQKAAIKATGPLPAQTPANPAAAGNPPALSVTSANPAVHTGPTPVASAPPPALAPTATSPATPAGAAVPAPAIGAPVTHN